jgi:hypothetical protein
MKERKVADKNEQTVPKMPGVPLGDQYVEAKWHTRRRLDCRLGCRARARRRHRAPLGAVACHRRSRRRLPAVSGSWIAADADERGRINIAWHRALPDRAGRGTVLARIVIHSDRAQRKKVGFGFSDEGSVFLTGDLVFTANNTYLSRSGRCLGIMTLDNDALYLPLRAGENELVIAVTEAFGGWGLAGRFEDLEGIVVEAAAP